MSRKVITEQQFNRVLQLLKRHTPEEVAATEGLRLPTVTTIQKEGTWAKHVARNEAKVRQQSAKRAMNPTPAPSQPTTDKRHRDSKIVKTAGRPTREAQPPADPVITPHMLNEAYKKNDRLMAEMTETFEAGMSEVRERIKQLTVKNGQVDEAREDLISAAIDVKKLERLLAVLHNSAKVREAQELIDKAKRKRWWPFRGQS